MYKYLLVISSKRLINELNFMQNINYYSNLAYSFQVVYTQCVKFMTSMRYNYLISTTGLHGAYLEIPDDCTHCRDVYSLCVCDHSLRPLRYTNITHVSYFISLKSNDMFSCHAIDMHI